MKILSILILFVFLSVGCGVTEPVDPITYDVTYIAKNYKSIIYLHPISGATITTTGSGSISYRFNFKNIPSGTYLYLSVVNKEWSATATIEVDGVRVITQTRPHTASVTYKLP